MNQNESMKNTCYNLLRDGCALFEHGLYCTVVSTWCLYLCIYVFLFSPLLLLFLFFVFFFFFSFFFPPCFFSRTYFCSLPFHYTQNRVQYNPAIYFSLSLLQCAIVSVKLGERLAPKPPKPQLELAHLAELEKWSLWLPSLFFLPATSPSPKVNKSQNYIIRIANRPTSPPPRNQKQNPYSSYDAHLPISRHPQWRPRNPPRKRTRTSPRCISCPSKAAQSWLPSL